MVNVVNSDLAANTTEDKTWYPCFVSKTDGRHHVFLKFFLSQNPRQDYDLVTSIRDGSVIEHLNDPFAEYRRSFIHFHIGLDIQTLQPGIDTTPEENASNWTE